MNPSTPTTVYDSALRLSFPQAYELADREIDAAELPEALRAALKRGRGQRCTPPQFFRPACRARTCLDCIGGRHAECTTAECGCEHKRLIEHGG